MHKAVQIILLGAMLVFFEQSNAQNFLNGDFEINTSSTCNFNMANATFTSLMADAVAYGGGNELDICQGSCGYGPAESGQWFVSLAYPGASDAFTMGLSAPLVAGTAYTIQFWDEGDIQYPPGIPVVIGVSIVAGATGTVVYTGPQPTIGVWNQRSFCFIAPNNGQYISVSTAGPTRWTHVDNFTITVSTANTITTGAIAGSPFCACSTINVPFTSTGVFTSGNIYTVQLSDSNGSFVSPITIGTLASTANVGTIACTIPCNALAGTLYQVQVISSAPSVLCSFNSVNIAISTAPIVTVNSPTICSGQTATLTGNGATTYIWSAGATSTGINTATVNPITTTSYTVTGSNGGCTDTAVALVTVNPGVTVMVNSPTICAGQTATLTATGATTYTWSAGATSTGGGNATASPITTTTYTVTGTTGSCSNTAVATVTVSAGVGPTVTVNSPTICSGNTAILTAAGATTYTWSAGVANIGADTATASPLTTTTYTVTGTTGNCSNTAISTVTVNPTPALTANNDTICAGQTVTLTANGATTYSWSIGSNVNHITVTDFVTTFYTVTGITNGCSKTISVAVYVIPPPVVTVTTDTVCPGFPATITASGATTYSWSTGSTSNTITVSPNVTTTYTVTGNPTQCASTPVVATVTVINIPATVIVNNATICDGQSTTLIATAAAGDTYLWSTGATTNSIIVSPNATTTYTVTVTNVCANTAAGNPVVTVNPLPVVSFTSTDLSGCVPVCTPFVNSSSVAVGTIASFNWNFGDGQTDDTTLAPIQTHCYTAAGAYTVSLRITSSNGCSDSLTLSNYINVYPIPVAAFTASPTETTLETANINFTNQSTGSTSWNWNFGDSTASSDFSPTHTYIAAATYPVTLIVSNNDGCLDTVTHYEIINENFAFYIPNSFSPNGDGINDVFIPKGTGWNNDSYQIWIYDRWGNLCFATNDVTKGWDGTVKGNIAQIDVYVWKVELRDIEGNSHNQVGSVTLLK